MARVQTWVPSDFTTVPHSRQKLLTETETGRYRSGLSNLSNDWSKTENKMDVLLPFFSFATYSLRYRRTKEDLQAEIDIWKRIDASLETEEKEYESLIEAARTIMSKAFGEIILICGIKDMIKADTQVSDETRRWILRGTEEDIECPDGWSPSNFACLKHIPGIKDMLRADKPDEEAEKPAEVSEANRERYKYVIVQLTSAKSKVDDLCSAAG